MPHLARRGNGTSEVGAKRACTTMKEIDNSHEAKQPILSLGRKRRIRKNVGSNGKRERKQVWDGSPGGWE